MQKVAASWSRSNLPPPEMDTMFRAIEGVYKANRSLYAVSVVLRLNALLLTASRRNSKKSEQTRPIRRRLEIC